MSLKFRMATFLKRSNFSVNFELPVDRASQLGILMRSIWKIIILKHVCEKSFFCFRAIQIVHKHSRRGASVKGVFHISYFKDIYTRYKFNKHIILQFGPVKTKYLINYYK